MPEIPAYVSHKQLSDAMDVLGIPSNRVRLCEMTPRSVRIEVLRLDDEGRHFIVDGTVAMETYEIAVRD